MPVRSDHDQDTYLYHYTNPAGSRGILRDKRIIVTEAESRFAWFGRGVYMTSLSPAVGRHRLLYNNHRKHSTRDPNLWAKTSIYFKIHIKHLPGAEKQNTRDGRDVWVYRDHINLNFVRYRTGNSDEYVEGPSQTFTIEPKRVTDGRGIMPQINRYQPTMTSTNTNRPNNYQSRRSVSRSYALNLAATIPDMETVQDCVIEVHSPVEPRRKLMDCCTIF